MNAFQRRIERLEASVGSTDERCPVCDGIIGGIALFRVENELGEPVNDYSCPECGEQAKPHGCATWSRASPKGDGVVHVKRIILTGVKRGSMTAKIPHWQGDPRWLIPQSVSDRHSQGA